MPGPFVVPNLTAVIGIRKKEIARGTYGRVYSTSKDYAVKTFLSKELNPSTMRETSILRYLDHPNVINLVAMQLEPPRIAMPLAFGTLKNVQLSKEKRMWYFYQLFRGLAYCHNKYVWHRDLKPENILLFDDSALARFGQIAKLADFGLSIPYARQGDNDTEVVSLRWRAPELLLGDRDYSGAIDVWSMGVMLMDAILGRPTLQSYSDHAELKKIFQLLGTPSETDWPGVTKLPDWPSFHPFSSTLDATIQADPDELEVIKNTVTWPNHRISALDVLKLSYFDTVRDTIETQIPAAPITVQPCGVMMLNEQQKIIKQDWFEPHRQKLYEQLWVTRIHMSDRTIFLAMFLMDLFCSRTVIETSALSQYTFAALFIAADLYYQVTLTYDDVIWLYRYNYSEKYIDAHKDTFFNDKELHDAKNNIIAQFDFKLVMPTCSDSIFHYTEDSGYSSEQYQQIVYHTVMLMLNYSYAIQYTQAQIAQIAIEAVELKPECLRDTTQLYDESIQKYFSRFVEYFQYL